MPWSLEEAISYHRRQGTDQQTIMALLREVQQEQGGSLPRAFLPEIAESFGVKESYLLAIIKRIPSLRLSDHHTLEVCAGPNCGKHAALAAFAEENYGDRSDLTVKFVPCMRLCGKGPNIKLDGQLYHRADEALLRRLISG